MMLLRCLALAGSGLLGTLAAPSTRDGGARVTTYNLPNVYTASEGLSLTANGYDVPIWNNTDFHIANFLMGSGTADLEIKLSSSAGSLGDVSVSPLKKNIKASVSGGNTVSFTLPHDDYYIIDGLGDNKPLVILADGEDQNQPDRNGAGVFDVTGSKYGAKAGGDVKTNTNAVQAAIDAASEACGNLQGDAAFKYDRAVVYIPEGIYSMGNLQLKSNVGLYLELGAVFHYTAQPADYTTRWFQSPRNVTWWISTEFGSENIRVYGRGILNCNSEQTEENGIVSNILVPILTKNFAADGIILLNSGSWGTTAIAADGARFENIKFLNRFTKANQNDGIDIMHSSNVTVKHAIGTGLDDNFSTKTWGNTDMDMDESDYTTWAIWKSWPDGIAQRNQSDITFEDCLAWSWCYGFKVGAGVFTHQTNLNFKNSVIYSAVIGFGIDHKDTIDATKGSISASAITFENLDVQRADGTNADNRGWMSLRVENGDGQDGAGRVYDVTVRNITVRNSKYDGMVYGLSDEVPMEKVTLEHIKIPGWNNYVSKLEDLSLNISHATEVSTNYDW